VKPNRPFGISPRDFSLAASENRNGVAAFSVSPDAS